MKKLMSVLGCMLLTSFLLSQEPVPPTKPTRLGYVAQTRPIAIPTSPTDLIQQSAYICYADIEATGQSVTIQDKQPTPVPWLTGVLGSSSASSTWIFVAPNDAGCRFFPNGVTWSANGSGATGYITIKCFSAPCKLVSGY